MKPERKSIFDNDDPPSKSAGLEAALSLFVQRGVDATSIRDIATRSGFTNPAVFKHFASKEALALCLFERCHAWIGRAFQAAEEDCASSDPVVRILAIVACALKLIDEDVEAVLMVQDHLRRFWRTASAATRARSLLGRMRALTAEAVGRTTPGPVAPNLLASAIMGLIGQIAREAYFHEFDGPISAREPEIRAVILRLFDRPYAEKQVASEDI